MQFKNGRGGAREGAGRKPKWSEPVIKKGIYVTVPQWLAAQREAKSRGTTVSAIVQEWFESMRVRSTKGERG